MPAQSNFVLTDGQATPVSHTFSGVGVSRQPDNRVLADWVDYEHSGSTLSRMSLGEIHRPANGAGNESIEWVLRIPTLKVVGGVVVGFEPAPELDFVSSVRIIATLNQRAPESVGADLAAFVKSFTATTYFANKVKKRERTW